MRNKVRFFIIMLLSCVFFPVTAEVSIIGEAGVSYAPQDKESIEVESGTVFVFDVYSSLNRNWSFFLDGLGSMYYNFGNRAFSYGAETGGDLSFISDFDLIRFGVNGVYSGSPEEEGSFFQAESELYYTHDFDLMTIYSTHSFSFSVLEDTDWLYSGNLGFPFMAGEGLLLEPLVTGGLLKDSEGESFFLDPALRFSWYPRIPGYLEGEMGFKIFFTDEPVYEARLDTAASYALNRAVQLRLFLPFLFQIQGISEQKWFYFEPGVVFDYRISPTFLLTAELSDRAETEFTPFDMSHRIACTLKLTLTP